MQISFHHRSNLQIVGLEEEEVAVAGDANIGQLGPRVRHARLVEVQRDAVVVRDVRTSARRIHDERHLGDLRQRVEYRRSLPVRRGRLQETRPQLGRVDADLDGPQFRGRCDGWVVREGRVGEAVGPRRQAPLVGPRGVAQHGLEGQTGRLQVDARAYHLRALVRQEHRVLARARVAERNRLAYDGQQRAAGGPHRQLLVGAVARQRHDGGLERFEDGVAAHTAARPLVVAAGLGVRVGR